MSHKGKNKENIAPSLELRGVSKSFGAVEAVKNANLKLESGEIMAIVGDNGAGKSTLMKIISGVCIPDQGQIFMDDIPVKISNPHDAKKLGIEMIYQDLALFDTLDVAANIFIGRERRNFHAVLDKPAMWDRAKELIDYLKVNIPSPKMLVEKMSGGQRQMVAVARSLAFGSKLLIMDEPNAALGVRESEAVLETINGLKGDHSIFLITQRLPDVTKVADRVAILKGGEVVKVLNVKETNIEEITEYIVMGVHKAKAQ